MPSVDTHHTQYGLAAPEIEPHIAILFGVRAPLQRPACAPVRTVIHMAEPNPACLTPKAEAKKPVAPRPIKSAGHHRTCATQRAAIRAYIAAQGRPVNRDELAAANGLRLDVISNRLQQMRLSGDVRCRRDGMSAVWALPEWEDTARD